MALSKIIAEGVDLTDTFAFTGTVTGAGEITASTTAPSEGGAATINVVQGLAKSWVNFNGSGPTVFRDSFNCASLLDNGGGDTTITLSSAFNDTNYSCAGSAQQNTAGSRGDFFMGLHQTAQTTTTRRVSTCDSGGVSTDSLIGNLQIWGDLA